MLVLTLLGEIGTFLKQFTSSDADIGPSHKRNALIVTEIYKLLSTIPPRENPDNNNTLSIGTCIEIQLFLSPLLTCLLQPRLTTTTTITFEPIPTPPWAMATTNSTSQGGSVVGKDGNGKVYVEQAGSSTL